MAKREVRVDIKAKDDTKKPFQSAARSAKGLQTSVFEVTATISSLTTIARSAISVVSSFGNTVKSVTTTVVGAAMEQEKAQAQLAATLESTNEAAGFTLEGMEDMASAFQSVTTYGDETVMGMQSILATFTKIGGEVFPDASMAILDMSAKMGTDLKGAALQVGKALNDPVIGVTALREVGVSFTETQVEMIKAMAKTGDVAGAQALMLAELKIEFGGSAEAARNTFGGALKSLQNAFGDTLESLGSFITQNEYLVNLMNGMAGIAADIAKNLAGMQAEFEGNLDVAEMFQGVIVKVIRALAGFARRIADFIDGFEHMKNMVVLSLGSMTVAVIAFKAASFGLVTILGTIISAAAALGFISIVADNFDTSSDAADTASAAFRGVANELDTFAKGVEGMDITVKAATPSLEGLTDAIGRNTRYISENQRTSEARSKALKADAALYKKEQAAEAAALAKLEKEWKGLNIQLVDGALSFGKVTEAMLIGNPTIENFKAFTGEAKAELMGFVGEIEKLSGEAIGDIVGGLDAWAASLEGLSLDDQAFEIGVMRDRLGQLAEAYRAASEAAEKTKAATESLRESNNAHITTINKNLEAIKKLAGDEAYGGWAKAASGLQDKLKTGNLTLTERNALLAKFADLTGKAAGAAGQFAKGAAAAPPPGSLPKDELKLLSKRDAILAEGHSRMELRMGLYNKEMAYLADRNVRGKANSMRSNQLLQTQKELAKEVKRQNREQKAVGLTLDEQIAQFHEMGLKAEDVGKLGGRGMRELAAAMKVAEEAATASAEAQAKAEQEAVDKAVKMRTEAVDKLKKYQIEAMESLVTNSEDAADAVAKAWEIAAKLVSDAANQQLVLLKLIVLNLDQYKLPVQHADGGYVTSPTYALIGEAGPETVIPESRPDRARELLSGLFSRNPNLLGSMGNGSSGGSAGSPMGEVNITVNTMMGDGDEIAETIAVQMDEILGRRALG